MPELSPEYWDRRYTEANTPWDIGYASPPLIDYAASFPSDTRILIPGAGRAYEAVHLHRQGYGRVYVCDWAESAFTHLREHAPDFPAEHQLTGDFFDLDLTVDLILEQTFFCALPVAQRPDYARHSARLLREGGLLAGLLFSRPFPFEGPPFGGTEDEYRRLFTPHFHILRMETAAASIRPRAGSELFIELERR